MDKKYSDYLEIIGEADRLRQEMKESLKPFIKVFKSNTSYKDGGSSFSDISDWEHEIDFCMEFIRINFFEYSDYGYESRYPDWEFSVDFPIDLINNPSQELAVEYAEEWNFKFQANVDRLLKEKKDEEIKNKEYEFEKLKGELGK